MTTGLAFGGVLFGKLFLVDDGTELIDALAHFDGSHFKEIAENGYSGSLPVFFPAYPLAVRWFAHIFGLDVTVALPIVSNGCLFVAFGLFDAYLRRRTVSGDKSRPSLAPTTPLVHDYSLMAMGLIPASFFFRMSYTESMFLCVAILAVHAMHCGWRLPLTAGIVGLATAVRPVGVGLLLPLAWFAARGAPSRGAAARRLAYAIPVGCWGLFAYMFYLFLLRGEPFAFATEQKGWHTRELGDFADKVTALLSWEPIWSVYVPNTPGYWDWGGTDQSAMPLFDLTFANPVYFVGTGVLIAVGAWRRWLTPYEILLAIPLLAIPYVTRAYEMRMMSHGRFAAVVFPVYVVIAQLLARMPTAAAIALFAISGVFMAAYAALFVTGHALI